MTPSIETKCRRFYHRLRFRLIRWCGVPMRFDWAEYELTERESARSVDEIAADTHLSDDAWRALRAGVMTRDELVVEAAKDLEQSAKRLRRAVQTRSWSIGRHREEVDASLQELDRRFDKL